MSAERLIVLCLAVAVVLALFWFMAEIATSH